MWKKIKNEEVVYDLTELINSSFKTSYYRYDDENNPCWCEISDNQAEMIRSCVETILGLPRDSIKESTRIEVNICQGISWVDITKDKLTKRA